MIIKASLVLGLGFLALSGCATVSQKSLSKVILDKSYMNDRPDWSINEKDSWAENETIYIKTSYTVRGDQRVNACYDLARLSVHEGLLAEIKSDVRAENNLASEGLSENEEQLMTKSLSESLKGAISGVNIQSRLFERYLINSTERIDCMILATMKKTDYEKLKRNSAQIVLSVAPGVAEAVREKQKNFFASEKEQ